MIHVSYDRVSVGGASEQGLVQILTASQSDIGLRALKTVMNARTSPAMTSPSHHHQRDKGGGFPPPPHAFEALWPEGEGADKLSDKPFDF